MKLIDRYLRWRIRRNHERHLRWLRRSRVMMNMPDPSPACRRNGPECAGKI